MVSCESLVVLRWCVYVLTCVVGGIMTLFKLNKSLNGYSRSFMSFMVYGVVAFWFASGPVVSGLLLGNKYNEVCDDEQSKEVERMQRFVYVYSLLVGVGLMLWLLMVLKYYWDWGYMCRFGVFMCIVIVGSWLGCTSVLLDSESLCN